MIDCASRPSVAMAQIMAAVPLRVKRLSSVSVVDEMGTRMHSPRIIRDTKAPVSRHIDFLSILSLTAGKLSDMRGVCKYGTHE